MKTCDWIMRISELIGMFSTYRVSDLLWRCWEKFLEDSERYRNLSVHMKKTPNNQLQNIKVEEMPVKSELLTILIAVHVYLPSAGGTEQFVHGLVSRLKDNGHRPVIVAHRADRKKAFHNEYQGILWRETQIDGVEVIEYRHVGKLKGLFTDLLFDDPCIRNFGKFLLEKYKPHVLHLAHLQKGSAFALACKEQGIPYIVTLTDFFCLCRYSTLIDGQGCYCHRSDCDTRCKSGMQSGSDRYKKAKEILKNALAVCVPSGFVARRIHHEYGILSHIIPHSINVPNIRFQREPHETARFLYVGKLSHHKGIHILIPVMKKLDFKWELLICGSGNPLYIRKLHKIAGNDERISFLGQLTRAELWNAYVKADVVIVPSVVPETYSFVLHEALAAGCSVAVSPIGALPEAIKEGINGAVFSELSEKEILSGLAAARACQLIEPPESGFPDRECQEYICLYNMGVKGR